MENFVNISSVNMMNLRFNKNANAKKASPPSLSLGYIIHFEHVSN